MDAVGNDVFGHHEGREDFQENVERLSSPRWNLLSHLPSLSTKRNISSSSKPSGREYAGIIGATDFHNYNQDATGFDDDSSSENSSRTTTVNETATSDHVTETDINDRQVITKDELDHSDCDEPDGRSAAVGNRNDRLMPHKHDNSRSADSDEVNAERRFMLGNETDLDAMLATASYRDHQQLKTLDSTKLVGVFGRDFDEPLVVAQHLQIGCDESQAVYRPVIIPRHELLSSECLRYVEAHEHDVVVFCYNTSEARILLTGHDGFYSSLLQYLSKALGEESLMIANLVLYVAG